MSAIIIVIIIIAADLSQYSQPAVVLAVHGQELDIRAQPRLATTSRHLGLHEPILAGRVHLVCQLPKTHRFYRGCARGWHVPSESALLNKKIKPTQNRSSCFCQLHPVSTTVTQEYRNARVPVRLRYGT
jgi:hypothetical protein